MTRMDEVYLNRKNKFTVGETIERMKPDGTNVSLKVIGIFDEDGNAQESAPHPKADASCCI